MTIRLILIAATVGLAAPLWAAAPGADAQPPKAPDSQATAVRDSVNAVLANASDKSEALLSWLQRKAEGAKDSAKDWKTYLQHKTDEAMTIPALEFGVRVLAEPEPKSADPAASGPAASGKLRWAKLSEFEGDAGKRLPSRLLLLVHGLDESGGIWDEFAPMAQEQGIAVARFDYPDDQGCAQSGDEFARALKDLRSRGVQTVDLVCHSMGGLIARDVLTRPDFDDTANSVGGGGRDYPRIDRFIMMGTPNKGTPLARLRAFAEAREQFMRWVESDSKDPRALLGFLKDGAGEAGDDLLPDSAYLKDLNSRDLPKGVRMTVIIGTMAAPESDALKDLLHYKHVRKVLGDAEIKKLESYLDSATQVVGDGIVTVDTAKLAGVDDTVFVDATHRTMVKRPMGETAIREALGEPARMPSAIPLILERLRQQ